MTSPRWVRAGFGLALCAATLLAQTTLNILNTNFPLVAVGQSYNQALQAIGGTSLYTWSVIGQIPLGFIVG